MVSSEKWFVEREDGIALTCTGMDMSKVTYRPKGIRGVLLFSAVPKLEIDEGYSI